MFKKNHFFLYLFSSSLKLIVARGMQDACKGHTIDNEDTMITFIFYLTLSINLNHIFIPVVISIQPWLASKYIKVFLSFFVAYKKTLLYCPLELMCLTILAWIEGKIFPPYHLQCFMLH